MSTTPAATPAEALRVWTATPLWVTLAVSGNAGRIFQLLASHLNHPRGDRLVWPSRASLAQRMGWSRPQSVDRYLRELVAAGAIAAVPRRRRDGGRATNGYVLCAPNSLPGTPLCAPPHQGVPGTRKRRSPAPPGTVPAQHTAPLPDPAPSPRTTHVRHGAHELHKGNNYSPPLPPHAAETGAHDPEVGEILEKINTKTPVGRGPARQLAVLIRAALDQGWTRDGLTEHLTRDLTGARWTAGALRWRLTEGLPLRPPGVPVLAATRDDRPPWCGTCHPHSRQLDDLDEHYRAVLCPSCHPHRVASVR